MSDRLALAHVIEDAGIPREKAEAVATAIARFVEGSSATKADVDHVEAALKADIARLEITLKAEIAGVHAKIDHVDTSLRAEIARVGDRTFNRLGALVAVAVAVLVAILHLWPPH